MLRFIPFNKMVDKRIPILLTVVFCLAPFLVFFICTDEFALWFYTKFGLDFNKFTMTRFDIINTVIDANLPNYGLGTVTDYLERRGVPGQTNMHNDILRIYMECTLLGSIIFTKNYFKMAEKNWFSLLTMIFIFMELFVAHFLGPGTISFWTIAYLDIYTFNNDYRNSLSF